MKALILALLALGCSGTPDASIPFSESAGAAVSLAGQTGEADPVAAAGSAGAPVVEQGGAAGIASAGAPNSAGSAGEAQGGAAGALVEPTEGGSGGSMVDQQIHGGSGGAVETGGASAGMGGAPVVDKRPGMLRFHWTDCTIADAQVVVWVHPVGSTMETPFVAKYCSLGVLGAGPLAPGDYLYRVDDGNFKYSFPNPRTVDPAATLDVDLGSL